MNNLSHTVVYAFVGWTASILSYILFLVWVFLPEDLLNYLGITYYPSKYYAVVLPAYFFICYLLSGIIYMSINMIQSPNPDEFCTVTDTYSIHENTSSFRQGILEISDLEPMYVSQQLVRQM
mmetsp:Transcript_15688/g.15824  ORF Transcript_15688/g.15824 Transcript_15688/m.15824 type:complete len:122 (+) Transcript_15688:182-547(+)